MRRAALLLPLLVGCGRRIHGSDDVPEDDPSKAWSRVLRAAVTPDGVDYDRVDEDRETLQDYVAWVGEHGPVMDGLRESKEDRRIAFLMNAYNALVIEALLQERDRTGALPASVRDVRFGPWALRDNWSFFLGQRVKVDGEWTTLYHLESHRLLARYQDPLPHVGLNCASRGCPPLRWWSERVGSKKLQPQLEEALEDWLADGALQQTETGYAVSELFFWYEDDFTYWSHADNLCQYLVEYVDQDAADWMLEHFGDCSLERIPYDWSLNAPPGGE
jgi:hypothetical protein